MSINMSTDATRLTLVHPGNAQKIVVSQPVVELDGDEMTRIIWKKIREDVRSSLMLSTLLQSTHLPFM
jgi:isocitrate dehydrogenase